MEDDLDEKFWQSLTTMGLDQEDLATLTKEKLKSRWKEWIRVHHQDKTGDGKAHQDFQVAYEFLISMLDTEDSFEFIATVEDSPPEIAADRLYDPSDICSLIAKLLQHKCWIIHARRDMLDLGKKIAKWVSPRWVYTYPSWVQGCTIFEQRVASQDHIRLLRSLVETPSFDFFHIRVPTEASVTRKIWVIWRTGYLYHSIAAYPVE